MVRTRQAMSTEQMWVPFAVWADGSHAARFCETLLWELIAGRADNS